MFCIRDLVHLLDVYHNIPDFKHIPYAYTHK